MLQVATNGVCEELIIGYRSIAFLSLWSKYAHSIFGEESTYSLDTIKLCIKKLYMGENALASGVIYQTKTTMLHLKKHQ